MIDLDLYKQGLAALGKGEAHRMSESMRLQIERLEQEARVRVAVSRWQWWLEQLSADGVHNYNDDPYVITWPTGVNVHTSLVPWPVRLALGSA